MAIDVNNSSFKDLSTGKVPEVGNRHDGFQKQRLISLDVYRGLIMVSLAFGGFGLAGTARNHLELNPGSWFWKTMKYEFTHTQWVGCSFWDLIQPSFMFMVGVSMAYSYAKRMKMGNSYRQMLGHALWRSLVLILLGVFLASNEAPSTNWSFMNVLAQIGLGYFFLFLLWKRTFPVQVGAGILLLVVTWILYVSYPYSGIDLQQGDSTVGISSEWAQGNLESIGSAWHKNANIGQAIDLRLLNAFPRSQPFQYNRGGYQTINFVPSLVTMLIGLMCGELLRTEKSSKQKFWILVGVGLSGLFIGACLHELGICPLVKKVWTPTWTLFSTGWCCLILAGLYGVIDVLRVRFWTFPLIVVGMNSIAIYLMIQLLRPWTSRLLRIHLGDEIFHFQLRIGEMTVPLLGSSSSEIGQLWGPTAEAIGVGLVFWLSCWWFYRQKIFFRI